MSQIETGWHKLRDAVVAGRVKFAVLNENADAVADSFDVPFSLEIFSKMIDLMSEIPRFVIKHTAIEILKTDQAMMSINDMMACGVLRLPYAACVVEYEVNSTTYNVFLREIKNDDLSIQWLASPVAYSNSNRDDCNVLAFPCQIELKFNLSGEPFDTSVERPDLPQMDYSVSLEPFFANIKNAEQVLDDAHFLAFNRCILAFLAAVILPQTIGIRQEAMDVKESLNRARIKKGRSSIPSYTVIDLENYQNESGSIQSLGDKTRVEVHLRRAHKRRVVFGPGRTGRVWRFFPPQVVGYLPDGRKPALPEILASRAAKPYIVKK